MDILIIDDNETSRRYLRERILIGRDDTIKCTLAGKYNEVLNLIKIFSYHMVIADYSLGGEKTGLDLLKIYKKKNNTGYSVLFTGTEINIENTNTKDFICINMSVEKANPESEKLLYEKIDELSGIRPPVKKEVIKSIQCEAETQAKALHRLADEIHDLRHENKIKWELQDEKWEDQKRSNNKYSEFMENNWKSARNIITTLISVGASLIFGMCGFLVFNYNMTKDCLNNHLQMTEKLMDAKWTTKTKIDTVLVPIDRKLYVKKLSEKGILSRSD